MECWCKKCNRPGLTENDFYKASSKKGISGYCKSCMKEYSKKRKKNSKEDVAKYNRTYREKHPTTVAKNNKKWSDKRAEEKTTALKTRITILEKTIDESSNLLLDGTSEMKLLGQKMKDLVT